MRSFCPDSSHRVGEQGPIQIEIHIYIHTHTHTHRCLFTLGLPGLCEKAAWPCTDVGLAFGLSMRLWNLEVTVESGRLPDQEPKAKGMGRIATLYSVHLKNPYQPFRIHYGLHPV